MKIGILSMQKIPNYGSFLQAYSLKTQLEKRGNDVYFIDIEPGRQLATVQYNNEFIVKRLVSKIFSRYVLKRIAHYFFHKKMVNIHKKDHTTFLETDKTLKDGVFDLVIIGSDEVFNCFNPSPWGFSPQLLGKVDNAKRIISYAASCGNSSYDDAVKHGVCDEIKSYLGNLSDISVRDENSKEFVEKISGRDALVHLDPVFITDFDKKIPAIPQRKPYILVYAYSNRICNKEEIKAIKDYAKKNKLQILSVGTQQRWCNHNITASAFELLAYVKNAECIITDTFHGTVFSIKYNKRFGVFVRDSNKNKLGGLLEQFGLAEKSITDINDFNKVMDLTIDFFKVNDFINEQCNNAYQYLDKNLKEAKK